MRPKYLFPLNLQMFAEGEIDPKTLKPKEDNPKPEDQTVSELVKAIADLKANSVPKAELEKVKEQNRELTKAIIEGSPVDMSNKTPEKKPNIKELAKACLEGGLSNYEMAKRQLAYREAVIEQKGKDPFVPNNHGVTDNDYARAQAVADAYEECINECEGNPELFDALLASRIKNDDPVMLASLKNKKK